MFSRFTLTLLAILVASGVAFAVIQDPPPVQPASQPAETEAEYNHKLGYAMGNQIGGFLKDLKRDGFDLDMAQIQKGIEDVMSGAENPQMTEAQCKETLQALTPKRRAKQTERQRMEGQKNRDVGTVFLQENGEKEGVVTLPSGLQYKVLRAGSGVTPTETQRVKAHYRGTLIDGTEFDSSYKRGEPTQFPVGGVIKGWQEALQLMKVGGKWMLYIPADLAYGDRAQGRIISPNSTLIFEIELIEVVKE